MSLYTFRAVVMAAFILAAASLAQSQTQWRSWVSALGNDSHSCARTAPCKTFAGALAKTTDKGEINCLTPGSYGTFTIDKSITIDCTGTFGGITATSTTDGIIVNAGTGNVSIRGLSLSGINAGYTGIKILAANRVIIENTVIESFNSKGISVETAAAAQVFISNSSIKNTGAYGISIKPTSVASVAVVNSNILGSFSIGIRAEMSDVAVTNCLIAGNGNGIQAGNNGTIRISGNTISENYIGMSILSNGKIISYGNNALTANLTSATPTSIVALQ